MRPWRDGALELDGGTATSAYHVELHVRPSGHSWVPSPENVNHVPYMWTLEDRYGHAFAQGTVAASSVVGARKPAIAAARAALLAALVGLGPETP